MDEDSREIVNQMQKVVLQMADDPHFSYICLEEDTITLKVVRF